MHNCWTHPTNEKPCYQFLAVYAHIKRLDNSFHAPPRPDDGGDGRDGRRTSLPKGLYELALGLVISKDLQDTRCAYAAASGVSQVAGQSRRALASRSRNGPRSGNNVAKALVSTTAKQRTECELAEAGREVRQPVLALAQGEQERDGAENAAGENHAPGLIRDVAVALRAGVNLVPVG